MVKTFSLIRGDTHYGPHTWDMDSGVVRGIHAAELNFYSQVPWQDGGSGIGSSAPAMFSNDGFIAMLMNLGFVVPPELTVENVPLDNTAAEVAAGIIN